MDPLFTPAMRSAADCVASLAIAVQEAGGDLEGVMEKARKLTALDFICEVLAGNRIRFVYVPREGKKEEKEPSAPCPGTAG